MKKIILIISTICICFLACKRTKLKYTISGTFFSECNVPLANTELEFYNKNTGGLVHSSATLGNVTTDGTGHFEFEYEQQKGSDNGFRISPVSSSYVTGTVLDEVPINKNINSIISYFSAKSFRVYKVSCSTPLTSNDTLFIGYTASSYKFYTGPIMDGTFIDTIETPMDYSVKYSDINTPTVLKKFAWGVGINNYKKLTTIAYDHDRTCGKYNIVTIPIN
jgi:hypothetical protein